MTSPYHPPIFCSDPFGTAPVFRPLADLSSRIKNKIKLEFGDGTPGDDERACCWCWTGSFRVARRRPRNHYVHPNFDGFWFSSMSFVEERGEPRLKIPERENAVPAHRAVWARAAGIEFDAVPKLSRCSNDRCVSPFHNLAMGPSPAAVQARKAIDEAGEAQPVSVLPVDMLEFLKERRPYSEGDARTAEMEFQLPPGSISDIDWVAYVLWDEANPEPDDD